MRKQDARETCQIIPAKQRRALRPGLKVRIAPEDSSSRTGKEASILGATQDDETRTRTFKKALEDPALI